MANRFLSYTGSGVFSVENRRLPFFRERCRGGPRPCPLLSCRHHLAWNRISKGQLQPSPLLAAAGPDRPVDDWTEDEIATALHGLPQTCALDVVEAQGPQSLAEVADLYGLARERIRQIEAEALEKLNKRIKR